MAETLSSGNLNEPSISNDQGSNGLVQTRKDKGETIFLMMANISEPRKSNSMKTRFGEVNLDAVVEKAHKIKYSSLTKTRFNEYKDAIGIFLHYLSFDGANISVVTRNGPNRDETYIEDGSLIFVNAPGKKKKQLSVRLFRAVLESVGLLEVHPDKTRYQSLQDFFRNHMQLILKSVDPQGNPRPAKP